VWNPATDAQRTERLPDRRQPKGFDRPPILFFVLFVNFVVPYPTAAKGRAAFIVQLSLSPIQMQQPSQNGGSVARTGPSITCFTKTSYAAAHVRQPTQHPRGVAWHRPIAEPRRPFHGRATRSRRVDPSPLLHHPVRLPEARERRSPTSGTRRSGSRRVAPRRSCREPLPAGTGPGCRTLPRRRHSRRFWPSATHSSTRPGSLDRAGP